MVAEFVGELRTLATSMKEVADRGGSSSIGGAAKTLLEACVNVARAWSGSFIGYQSTVYYEGLQPPPQGAYFSSEWGLMTGIYGGGSRGSWIEYRYSDVIDAIEQLAGNPDLSKLDEFARVASNEFVSGRSELISILTSLPPDFVDSVVEGALEEVRGYKLASQDDFIRAQIPSGQFASRDTRALHDGIRNPPHLGYQAGIVAKEMPGSYCEKIATLADRVANHLTRKMKAMTPDNSSSSGTSSGSRVFIGHGGSREWLELKNHIQDRLHIPCDDFQREPTAGYATTARLETMMDAAAFAFIVATAEDERADGTMHARENVVHELGLFQGRLGFTKAILVKEESCAEFSNIVGLGQIRFPDGNLSACFHEVQDVLRREGLIQ
jgi:predicted nucleotide-binding protein